MIDDGYAAVAARLLREFRIFSGSNAIAFLLVGLLAHCKRDAGPQLLVPSACLLLAAAITGVLYVTQQDWLHTLVFGDFVGFAYIAYLAVVGGFLIDIAMNRARVTTVLCNAVLESFGAALVPMPC